MSNAPPQSAATEAAVTVKTKIGTFGFRLPTIEEHDRYEMAIGRGRAGVAYRELCGTLCVQPPRVADEPPEALQQLFEQFPRSAAQISDHILDAAIGDLELERDEGARRVIVQLNGKPFAFRAPTLDEWEDCQEAMRALQVGAAHRALCESTLEEGGLEELRQAIAAYPRASSRIGDYVADLADGDLEITVKKG
jgi:hypothetical protein